MKKKGAQMCSTINNTKVRQNGALSDAGDERKNYRKINNVNNVIFWAVKK